MSQKELNEFKADGEDSEIADAVEKNGKGNRKADVFKSVDPTAEKVTDLLGLNKGEKLIGAPSTKQAPPRKADKRTMKEHTDDLFEGQELSEEFMEHAAAILEAAVIERVAEIKESIEAEYEAKLEESVDALTSKMDDYLNYVVENWMEENQVEIESATKVAMAESLMDGLRTLFVEHNIEITEETIDVVENMELRIAELENALNESIEQIMEYEKVLTEATKEEIVSEVSEGLTETQKDRLTMLAENIEYANMDEFVSKVVSIKESFLTKRNNKSEEFLNEEFDGEVAPNNHSVDPVMASYLAAVSKNTQK